VPKSLDGPLHKEATVGSKVNRKLAFDLIEKGIAAIEGTDEAHEAALQGPLGRRVRLHHELDLGYQDPGVLESKTAPLTLLREFLESIEAVEQDHGEWWVEPSEEVDLHGAELPTARD
jgi:hypothetical protein